MDAVKAIFSSRGRRDRKDVLCLVYNVACLVEDKSHLIVAYCHLFIHTVLMVVNAR